MSPYMKRSHKIYALSKIGVDDQFSLNGIAWDLDGYAPPVPFSVTGVPSHVMAIRKQGRVIGFRKEIHYFAYFASPPTRDQENEYEYEIDMFVHIANPLFRKTFEMRFELIGYFAERKTWRFGGRIKLGEKWVSLSASSLQNKHLPTDASIGDKYQCCATFRICGKNVRALDGTLTWSLRLYEIDDVRELQLLPKTDEFSDKVSAVIISKDDDVLLLERDFTTDNFLELGFRCMKNKHTSQQVGDTELEGLSEKELKCLRRNTYEEKGNARIKFFRNQIWGWTDFNVGISDSVESFRNKIDGSLSRVSSSRDVGIPFVLPGGKIDKFSLQLDDTEHASVLTEIVEKTGLNPNELERIDFSFALNPIVPPDTLMRSLYNRSIVHVYRVNKNSYEMGLRIGKEFRGCRFVSIHQLEDEEILRGELNEPVRDALRKVKANMFPANDGQ